VVFPVDLVKPLLDAVGGAAAAGAAHQRNDSTAPDGELGAGSDRELGPGPAAESQVGQEADPETVERSDPPR
jgi:hypothetical protein